LASIQINLFAAALYQRTFSKTPKLVLFGGRKYTVPYFPKARKLLLFFIYC